MATGTESFVKSIIDAHGGLATYAQLSSIEAKFDFTGAMLALKARPQQHLTPSITVSTREQKVTFRGLGGGSDEEWVFTPNKVYKQRVVDQIIISARENPREAFANHDLTATWDDFHFLYFAGYALWQYFNFPYLLSRDDVTSRELEPHHEAGQIWRVLEVTFPDPFVFASHTKVQTYYFNEKFVLQRHDYAPDILANSPAAHYSYDPIVAGGLTFPSIRRVVSLVPGADGTLVPLTNGPIPTLIILVFFSIELKSEHQTENDPSASPKRWSLLELKA